ncbi:MAG: hypothetical protein N2442_08900 [Spirochaetes bacterium]|nr:hypothetical protein [Spirochaetota bacterium]
MKKHDSFILSTWIILFAFFQGCSSYTPKTVVLTTSRKEVAAYIETFNTDQNDYRIELRFTPDSPVSIPSEGSSSDIIISEYLAGNDTIKKFRPLDGLFFERKIPLRDFYTGLLKLGKRDNRQYLLPVSFDLPILIYDNRFPGKENELFLLNLEEVRAIAKSFLKIESGKIVQIGFSPLWYGDFILLTTQLFGADYTEDPVQVLRYNSKNLNQAIDFLKEWSQQDNGGPTNELRYKEKYLTTPPYRQVSLGWAHYAYSSASSFFLLPENRRLSLNFRWIGHKGKILALDSILYIGIPEKASNPKGAEAFLSWFFQLSTQKRLLEASQMKFTYSFGIFGGFSSLTEINEKEYPRLYPYLMGHIPPAELLDFPPPVPYAWVELKKRILLPYLIDQLQTEKPQGTLEDRLKTWILSKPIR